MEVAEDSKGSLVACDGNSLFCLPPRSAAAMISILSLSLSILDAFAGPACYCGRGRGVRGWINWLRILLLMMFQVANLLLLLASVVENATLVRIYVWYTLGFVAAGTAVALADFALGRGSWALTTFLVEMAFLFMIFRCLPIVESYRKNLEGSIQTPAPTASITSYSQKE